mmetsp:Transcript_30155/g.68496  ORF Transcript_30155/g.68496 Transcript_30155/m.68496 type:complete len:208 (-) Transcript_30155:242-865(-)
MTAFTKLRVCPSASNSCISLRPSSQSPLETNASTMHPMVMLVGTMSLDRISRQSSQVELRSPRSPYARMRLPKVCAPLTFTGLVPHWRCSCFPRRSLRPVRMHASQTELNRISSMVSSNESTKATVLSTSTGREVFWMVFNRMEQVTLLGSNPQAFISSMSTQAPVGLLARTVASMSSLKVTQLGCRVPPAARMVSMAARARPRSPR